MHCLPYFGDCIISVHGRMEIANSVGAIVRRVIYRKTCIQAIRIFSYLSILFFKVNYFAEEAIQHTNVSYRVDESCQLFCIQKKRLSTNYMVY